MGTLLQLSLAYALPLALTALLFVKQWQTRRLLAILLVVLPCFYVLHFVGLRALTGWPSDAAPPDEFELIYEHVMEPDKNSGTAGAIYLWLATPASDAPRAYRLPYSKPLHEQVTQAADRRSSGKAQIGQRRPSGGPSAHDGQPQPEYRFFNQPNRRPPPKTESGPSDGGARS